MGASVIMFIKAYAS